MSKQSWVWKYAKRKGDKAICGLCENDRAMSCVGGTTGSIGRHLTNIHNINPPTSVSAAKSDAILITRARADSEETELDIGRSIERNSCGGRKRRHPGSCDPTLTEDIHQALAKMIAIEQLPLSFCSSDGFKQFMAIAVPKYVPCQQFALKNKLVDFQETVKEKIIADLRRSASVACTSDCWTSRAQDGYITITANIIKENWEPATFTLATISMEERHTASNLVERMDALLRKWEIREKVVAIVTNNAANMINCVKNLQNVPEFIEDVTCAGHTIQLAVNKCLCCCDNIQPLLKRVSKIVSHFKHSTVTMGALEQKQLQLGLDKLPLLQSCITRWNSTYYMLERFLNNRNPIVSVFADRMITPSTTLQKMALNKEEWLQIEILVELLKPLEVITTVLCSDNHSPISMVRPLLFHLINSHYQHKESDTAMVNKFKATATIELKTRFHLEGDYNPPIITARQVSSLMDPRYKDLSHENETCRQRIRDWVLQAIHAENIEQEQIVQNSPTTALEYIYNQREAHVQKPSVQFDMYLTEVQLRFNHDPFDWWRTHAEKYPALNVIAKKLLTIPATSTSSKRSFSTAGNIVTAKRSCLLPENVDLMVFLYQNRSIL